MSCRSATFYRFVPPKTRKTLRVGGFWITLRDGARRDRLACVCAESRQVRHERRHLERHLLAFGDGAHWLALDQRQRVVPRIQFHTAADWQRRDHLGILLRIHWNGRFQVRKSWHAISQVRADQVRNFFLPRLHRCQEQSCIPQLILVGRIVQELDCLCIRRFFFIWCVPESKVAECVLIIDQQLIEPIRKFRIQRIKNS
jgi:hypothetical protein